MLIFLVGYMGSGKTKTGRVLARKLGYDFLDTDEMIEAMEKKSVAEIFSISGEEKFRTLEKAVLHSVANVKNTLVSTGGGLPCFGDNMDEMNAYGFTVYLKVPHGMLTQRLSIEKSSRPLLQGLNEHDLAAHIINQLQEREVFYSKAKLIYNAASININLLQKEILSATERIN